MAKNPKPFLDVLFGEPEGLEIPIRMKRTLHRKGEIVVMKTTITPIHDKRYAGDVVITEPLLQRESKIAKPDLGLIKLP